MAVGSLPISGQYKWPTVMNDVCPNIVRAAIIIIIVFTVFKAIFKVFVFKSVIGRYQDVIYITIVRFKFKAIFRPKI